MFRVVIIGAGLGGLACAIACLRNGFEVIILEQAPEIQPVGAGIQVPPNAGRVLEFLGIRERLHAQSVITDALDLLRWEDGSVICHMPAATRMRKEYGSDWAVVHRADYHFVLLNTAIEAGAQMRLDSKVESINFENSAVELKDGTVVSGDIIVGADGLWSTTRDRILGYHSPPHETGDLAYRATFKTADLLALNDASIAELVSGNTTTLWMGPEKHVVMYPLKGGQEQNVVLLRPDNLPAGVGKAEGDIDEMRETFKGWDPRLTTMVSMIPSVLKWKLCYHEPLETWCKANVTVLGDACHPTLPYQAQGAAMAVEDGAVLGLLLGLLARDVNDKATAQKHIPSILKLYESLRKDRTSLNVKGAVANRHMYHLEDCEEQRQRDAELKDYKFDHPVRWRWADPASQMDLLGFDVIKDGKTNYKSWRANNINRPPKL